MTEDDFPEGEEDDDDEEGSVVVTEGREGFVSGLQLARILGDILEQYVLYYDSLLISGSSRQWTMCLNLYQSVALS